MLIDVYDITSRGDLWSFGFLIMSATMTSAQIAHGIEAHQTFLYFFNPQRASEWRITQCKAQIDACVYSTV